MTCRHEAGDPNCSSSPEYQRRTRLKSFEERTPDPDKFEIVDVEQVGPHLVLKVKYLSCVKCAFEGTKVLVIFNSTIKDVIRWKRIDPHFRDPSAAGLPYGTAKESPSPAARFPGSPQGWTDAMEWAQLKAGGK